MSTVALLIRYTYALYGSGRHVCSRFNIADTVERLCDRISTSSLLEDRRDAVRGLKALSRKYRVEVGAQGLSALAETLGRDQGDSEILVRNVLLNVSHAFLVYQ